MKIGQIVEELSLNILAGEISGAGNPLGLLL